MGCQQRRVVLEQRSLQSLEDTLSSVSESSDPRIVVVDRRDDLEYIDVIDLTNVGPNRVESTKRPMSEFDE